MNHTVIRAEGLRKVFRLPGENVVAVNGVDLEIQKGDFISLMGPSGSGKTTLLDLLGCLSAVTDGHLTVFGKDVSKAREHELVGIRRGRIGFVFQDFLLISELTALENVLLPMAFARMKTDRARALMLLDRVGLAHRARHLPKELSGGERQRVAIARSLAASPGILIADEPTGNLDTKNSEGIYAIFETLNREENLTIVTATHNEHLGARAGRHIHMKDGKLE